MCIAFRGELLVQTVEQQLLLSSAVRPAMVSILSSSRPLICSISSKGLPLLGALGKVRFLSAPERPFCGPWPLPFGRGGAMAAQLRTAFLDFFVGLSLQPKSFVLCFDQRFLALLLCGFHSVVDQALGLFLRAADLCPRQFCGGKKPRRKNAMAAATTPATTAITAAMTGDTIFRVQPYSLLL